MTPVFVVTLADALWVFVLLLLLLLYGVIGFYKHGKRHDANMTAVCMKQELVKPFAKSAAPILDLSESGVNKIRRP